MCLPTVCGVYWSVSIVKIGYYLQALSLTFTSTRSWVFDDVAKQRSQAGDGALAVVIAGWSLERREYRSGGQALMDGGEPTDEADNTDAAVSGVAVVADGIPFGRSGTVGSPPTLLMVPTQHVSGVAVVAYWVSLGRSGTAG